MDGADESAGCKRQRTILAKRSRENSLAYTSQSSSILIYHLGLSKSPEEKHNQQLKRVQPHHFQKISVLTKKQARRILRENGSTGMQIKDARKFCAY